MAGEANKTLGEIVSRLAMFAVAAALIFGGVRMLHEARAVSAKYYHDHPYLTQNDYQAAKNDADGSLLYKIGWGLVSAGTLFGLGALTPLSVLERFYSPPEL